MFKKTLKRIKSYAHNEDHIILDAPLITMKSLSNRKFRKRGKTFESLKKTETNQIMDKLFGNGY
jgi:hypothetical protein